MGAESILAGRLIQVALQLQQAKLWLEFDDEHAFAFDIPGQSEPVAGCIRGGTGSPFGLLLFRDGLTGLQDLLYEGEDRQNDELALLVSPLRDVPTESRGLLETARWSGRRDTLAPHLVVQRPGTNARNPRRGEMRLALYAATALLTAWKAGELELCAFDNPDGVPLLRLSGPPHDPTVEWDRLVLDGDARAAYEDLSPAVTPTRLLCEDPERVDVTWSIGVFALRALAKNDPDRPLAAVVIADADSWEVLHTDLMLGAPEDRAAEVVRRYADGERGEDGPCVPREIRCMDRYVHESIAPLFEEHGVRCSFEPDQPELQAIGADMQATMERGGADAQDMVLPQELRKWHAEIEKLIDLLDETAGPARHRSEHALGKFFGSASLGNYLLATFPSMQVIFQSWLLTLHRAEPGAKTALELLLQREDIPESQRALALAAHNAWPSIYRIERIDPPFADLTDLVGTGDCRVCDAELAETMAVGSLLCGLVFEAGAFRAVLAIGPWLPAKLGKLAFDHLEEIGIPVTPDGLARHHYFGGRIAAWYAERDAAPSRMRNTDGHDIVSHVAEFRIDDADAVAAQLGARSDMQFDKNDECFDWVRKQGLQDANPIILGQLKLRGDQLVLDCDSAQRYEQARALLERIEGVEFVGLQEHAIE